MKERERERDHSITGCCREMGGDGNLVCLLCRGEFQADRVDAVSLVGGSLVAFALEYVSQVSTALCAHDLDSTHAVSVVFVRGDGSRETLEESGPAAAGVELGIGLVEWCVTSGTVVDARIVEVIVLSRTWSFGALLSQDLKLLWSQNGPPLLLRLLNRKRVAIAHVAAATTTALRIVGSRG